MIAIHCHHLLSAITFGLWSHQDHICGHCRRFPLLALSTVGVLALGALPRQLHRLLNSGQHELYGTAASCVDWKGTNRPWCRPPPWKNCGGPWLKFSAGASSSMAIGANHVAVMPSMAWILSTSSVVDAASDFFFFAFAAPKLGDRLPCTDFIVTPICWTAFASAPTACAKPGECCVDPSPLRLVLSVRGELGRLSKVSTCQGRVSHLVSPPQIGISHSPCQMATLMCIRAVVCRRFPRLT